MLKIEAKARDTMLTKKRHSFCVMARIRGLPEKADELRKSLLTLVKLTRNENGCLSCEMIENGYDSTEFTLIEKWSDEEAHNAHFSTILIQNAMKMFQGLLSGELGIRKQILRLHAVRYGTNSYCTSMI